MLFPSVFGENLFDDFFSFPDLRNVDKKLYGKRAGHMMKTDIREHDDRYELCVDLPGFSKEDVHLSLDNGFLLVNAEKAMNNDEKDKDGKVIRRERYSGSMQRNFYVGDLVTEEDVKAAYENGVLTITVPKKDAPQIPEKKYIAIG